MIQTNTRYLADGLALLALVPAGSIAAAFFDPQYRGVLDHLAYGNEGVTRAGDRVALPQMEESTIQGILAGIARALKPSGHVFLWIDKYHLVEGSVRSWATATDLQTVSMVTWDKVLMGMGHRARCQLEHCVILQKPPIRAKGIWTDRAFRDYQAEQVPRIGGHPHKKPPMITRRLIEAVTRPGDTVLDPAAGGFVVMTEANACGREFLGGDLSTGVVALPG